MNDDIPWVVRTASGSPFTKGSKMLPSQKLEHETKNRKGRKKCVYVYIFIIAESLVSKHSGSRVCPKLMMTSRVVVKSTRLDSTRLLFPKRNSRRRTTNLQLFFLFFFFLSFKSKNVKFYFSDFNWKEINPSSRSLSLSLWFAAR